MNDSILVLLLQIIKNNGSIENLIQRGYKYSQVALLVSEMIDEGYVQYEEDYIEVTKIGNEKLAELNTKYNKHNSTSWISPQEQYRIKGIGKFDIYLPRTLKLNNNKP